MKIVKISKWFQGGHVEHLLCLPTDTTDSQLAQQVKEWCDSDPNGRLNGYSYHYKEIKVIPPFDKKLHLLQKIIDQAIAEQNKIITFVVNK